MKNRIVNLLLCLALTAAFLPVGTASLPATAEEDNLYKTENVTVPEGWRYVEVSTAEELEAAPDSKNCWSGGGQPTFIRLTQDITVRSVQVDNRLRALIYFNVWSPTIIDLNGHTVKGEISAAQNGDNRTWATLSISLCYGICPDLSLRIVDSAGGGGVSLHASTDVDGPTNALMIQGFSLLRNARGIKAEDCPYDADKARVSIDGGSYYVYTLNEKFTGVQGGPMFDSNGYPRWGIPYEVPYTRSAVGLYDCRATVNNGHFTAKCNTDGSVAGDMGRRFLSALGLVDYFTAEHLQINGGVFDGDAYSVLWYNIYGSDGELSALPVLNGGTFTGGIQYCSTRGCFWKKLSGMYTLNGKMKDKKVSEILLPGAKMYMDGKLIDPDDKDLEDIAWPHEIVIEGGPQILQSRLACSALLLNRRTGYSIQYNQTPDKVQLEEYITVIRLGQEQSHWDAHKTTDYILVPAFGTNTYNVTVPAEESAGARTFRVRAFFGEAELVSDPFEVEWVDTNGFQFTYGPEVTSEPGVGVAWVEFNFNHEDALRRWGLWWSNGDHWTLLDEVNYLSPDYNPSSDNYRIYISQLAAENYEEMDYYITVEYDLGTEEPLEIESDPFTVTKDMLGGELPDPIGIGIFPGVCILTPEEEQAVCVTLFPTASPHKTGFLAESSDPAVAEVVSKDEEGFVIRGLKAGSATVTVTAAGGVYAECEVTVAGDFVLGDVDGDGSVTSTDARLVLQLSVGKITESDLTVPAAADVDRDGNVTSTDARLILQKSVGKIQTWP